MGNTPCKEVKNVNRGELRINPNEVNSDFPFSLFLLSLIKIKEINELLKSNQEKIETNRNLKLLPILNDLNKSTRLINCYVNEFETIFSKELSNINGINFYSFALNQISNEMKIIDRNFNEDSLLKLFYFNINKKCLNCKTKTDNYNCYLFNMNIFDVYSFEDKLFCEQCNSGQTHLISTNSLPKIIISIKMFHQIKANLYKYRESNNAIENDYYISCYYDKQIISYIKYENIYKYDKENNHYQKLTFEEFTSNVSKDQEKVEKIAYIYRHKDLINEREDQSLIDSFFANKNFRNAIINYYMIKTENNIENKMYLVNKEYFDYLLVMNNIDLKTVLESNNNFVELDIEIQRNQNEIMNMNKLIIYDDPCKIIGDIDFVNEEILKQLGINQNEYLGKEVIIKQINLSYFQIIFKDNTMLKLVIKDNQQELIFNGECTNQQINIMKSNTQNNKMMLANNINPNNNMINNSNNNQNINQILNLNKYQNRIQSNNSNTNQISNQNNNKDNSVLNVENHTKIEENQIINIENKFDKEIKEIKDKLLLYSSELTKIFNDILEVKNKINKRIVSEKDFLEYLVMDKKYYNQLTKIYESNETYENDNIIFTDIKDISNIQAIDNLEKLKSILDNFEKRKKSLKSDNPFQNDYEKEKIDKDKISYPKNFVLIKEETLKEILSKLDIKYKKNKNSLYKALIGDEYIFLQDNDNKNNIFVCNSKNIIFNVEMIIKFDKEDQFLSEVKKHIIKTGFNMYLKYRNIDLSKKNQDLINLEDAHIGKIAIVIKSNPYIKAIFDALSSIPKLKESIGKIEIKQNFLSFLLHNYIKANNNLIELNKNILDVESHLNKLSKNSLNNSDFKKLIKLILKTLNNELNIKKNDATFKIEDYDPTFVLNQFNKNVEFYKDSIIYNLFCGHKKIELNCKKCNSIKSKFKIFYCLFFKIEKSSPKDLNTLISSYEKENNKLKGQCDICFEKDKLYIKNREINKFPEILIIILDNKKKDKLDCPLSLQIKNENYNLISCISKQDEKSEEFSIITKNESKYFIFDGNEKKEFIYDSKKSITNPYVLFYEKKENNNEPEEIYLNNDNPPSFINPQKQMEENESIINNNLGNPMLNNNNNIKASVNNSQNNLNENAKNNNSNDNPIYNLINNDKSKNNLNNNMNQISNQINQNNNNNNNQLNNMMNIGQNQQNIINNINQQNNNINNLNNNNQNNMMQMNPQNNMNQQNIINKTWDPLQNMNNIRQQNNMNNMNFNNNMNQANSQQQNIVRSMLPNNNFNQNNNQMNIMNNNMKIPNQMMNINPNMQMNNNMNNQFNNQMNNNMMNPNIQNFQNGFNRFNQNNQMMNMNMNNMQQFNNGMQMNNQQIQFMNQNNPNNNQMMNNNQQIFNQNNMNQNNNQLFNQINNQNSSNNNFMNQNNFQMPNNNRFFNGNNNQMNNNNNNQFLNQNRNQMMNNNNQFFNHNNNQMNNNNISPQMLNNMQNMNQISNNMPMIPSINNQNFPNNQNQNIQNASSPNIGNNDSGSENNNDEITLYFNFRNDKQIYIDVDKNIKFSEVIDRLKEKYEWLKPMKILGFMINGRKIDPNKSCAENRIEDSSKILIIEE